MKKTYIAIAVTSLMTIGGGAQAAGSFAYDNQNKVDDDLTASYDSSYDRIAIVDDGQEHTISASKNINWTHNDSYEDGSIFAGTKKGDRGNQITKGSHLSISANAINITSIGQEGKSPNLIHAYGGTVDLTAVNDINLAISNDGGALMSQAVSKVGSSLLTLTSTAGSINVTSDGNTVLAGMLQDGLDDFVSKVKLTAAQNITLTSKNTGKAAVQLYNQNKDPENWNGKAGTADVEIDAVDTLTLNGDFGLVQFVQNDKVTSTTKSLFTAGKAINVNASGRNAVYVSGKVKEGNTATFAAPLVNLTSAGEKQSTIYAGQNADVTFDNKSNSVVNITSNQGAAIQIVDSNSSVSFNKSTVNSAGNVLSGGTVNLTDSNLNLKDGSIFNSHTVGGSNSSITVEKLPAEDSTNNKVVSITDNQSKGLVVAASGALNDKFNTPEDATAALINATDITNNEKEGGSNSFAGQSGVISDGFTADAVGNIISRTTNQSLDAFGNYNAMTLVQWRNEVNHISQRLGDVRDSSTTIGAWARVYGYDSSYDDNVSIDFKANSIQAGGDYRINNTWLVGGAFSYTDGEGKFSNGSADSDGYSLAAYLSGFFDCGGYVDFVGRIGRLSTDITAYSDASEFKGSYNNTTFGLSAEVGYHWKLNDTFYVEPQAELAYGFVKGDDFTGANDVRVEQDDFQTLVGRLGARIGASFADGAGTVYAHASVNHDFLGDADYTASLDSVSRDLSVDIGGTWVSYGIGAQFNTSKNLNFYGTLERANGSEYQEDYRYSVGMSYRF